MIIRAIDIGYQKTKLMRMMEKEWELLSFPSIAPIHSGMGMSTGFGGLMGKRDTKIIEVDGISYEVGPDADDLQSVDNVKALDNNYIFTDTYKAIFKGALDYLEEDSIDILVVGLPINNLMNAEKLREMSVGNHTVSDGRTVEVKDVLVIPQPLGGFYAALNSGDPDLANMKNEFNLIVDPGSVTFDFLCTHGIKPIENRSDAHPGGMIKVLNAISESIKKTYQKEYKNLVAIERALLTPERMIKLPWEEKEISLEEHIKQTRNVLESSVTAMKNKAGDGSEQELNNIVIVGGGSQMFKKQIAKQYPDHKIKVLSKINIKGLEKVKNYSPMFANVLGYVLAGCHYSGIEFDKIT